jgi:hypothetical protein
MQDRTRVIASIGSVAMLVVGCSTDSPSVVDGSSSGGDITSVDGTSVDGTSDGVSMDDTSSDGITSDGTTSDGTTSDGTTSDGTTSSSGGADSDGTGATSDASTSGGLDPVCGNGLVEADEACDDMGESPACNADCTLALCGDELVNASAGEICDSAGASAGC